MGQYKVVVSSTGLVYLLELLQGCTHTDLTTDTNLHEPPHTHTHTYHLHKKKETQTHNYTHRNAHTYICIVMHTHRPHTHIPCTHPHKQMSSACTHTHTPSTHTRMHTHFKCSITHCASFGSHVFRGLSSGINVRETGGHQRVHCLPDSIKVGNLDLTLGPSGTAAVEDIWTGTLLLDENIPRYSCVCMCGGRRSVSVNVRKGEKCVCGTSELCHSQQSTEEVKTCMWFTQTHAYSLGHTHPLPPTRMHAYCTPHTLILVILSPMKTQRGSFQIIPQTFEITVLGVVPMEVTESQQDLMEDVADARLDQLLPSLGIILNQLTKRATLLVQSAKDLPQVS